MHKEKDGMGWRRQEHMGAPSRRRGPCATELSTLPGCRCQSLLPSVEYRMFPMSPQSERHTLLSNINFILSKKKLFTPNSQSLFQCARGIIMFSFSLSESLWGLQSTAFLFTPSDPRRLDRGVYYFCLDCRMSGIPI